MRARDRIEEREDVLFGGTIKYLRLKSGRLMSFWDAMKEADASDTAFARSLSRAFKLAANDWDFERVEARCDAMESYLGAVRAEIEKRRGVKSVQERIALLRNANGRTPEEANLYRLKADELESKLMASGSDR